MSDCDPASTIAEFDAERAGQILLDILSFADAGSWREPDPLPNPFAELPAA